MADLNTVRASAPAGIVLIETLELIHSSFNTPIRITNQFENVTATLEATAPVDAGQSVVFQPCPFSLILPRAGDGGNETLDITISNVDQIAADYLEMVMENLGPLTVIYRIYTSDDLSGPAEVPPTTLTLESATADTVKIVAKARNTDNINQKFPRYIYNTVDHPGLAR